MEIKEYFDKAPKISDEITSLENFNSRLGFFVAINHDYQNINQYDLAIIGVCEDRNANNKGCDAAPNHIRNELYQLFLSEKKIRIIDLGNLKQGKTINDTYAGLKYITAELLKMNVLPLIIGGSQDLSWPIYQAYESINKTINITAIDSKLDIGNAEENFHSQSYVSKIVLNKSKHLFNYSNIGFQTYLVPSFEIELMDKLFFDAIRLGLAQSDIKECEPIIRNADFISIDIGVVRQSDAPGSKNTGPNGFYAEEICQLATYAGFSDKITSFGLFETNPRFDREKQTVQLAAQIIWHFIFGFYQRKNEDPYKNEQNFKKFLVKINEHSDELIFYKSLKTDRWWLEIPHPNHTGNSLIIPCSFKDYEIAAKQEIPDRWWRYFQKLL